MRRLLVLAALAVGAWPTATASAGTYTVQACGGVANGSWSIMSRDAGMAAYPDAPFCSESGLVVRNVDGGAGATVANGSAARWRFDAPAGTAIVGVSMNGAFTVNGQRWQAVLSNGSQILLGCRAGASCQIGTGAEVTPVPSSSTIYTEAYCAAGPCDADGLRAQVFMRSVSVVLSDSAAPTIAAPRGPAVDRPWIGATLPATIDAADASGIATVRAAIDGKAVSSFARPCDATAKRCSDFGGSVDVATRGLPDGKHKLSLEAVDRAGNVGTLSRDVFVDNTPPTRPENVVRPGGEWSPTAGAKVTWANPEQAFAPIAGAEFDVCPVGRTTGCTHGSGTSPTEAEVGLPAPGIYDVYLYLRDAAGNAERQNAAPVMRMGWDADAPTTAAFAPIEPADPSLIRVTGSDATSGIAGGAIEFRRKGAKAWRPIKTTVDGSSVVARMPDGRLRDGHYQLRATVRDAAGNARSTRTRANGRSAAVRLPLRIKARLTAGRPRGSRFDQRPRTRAGKPSRLAGRLVGPGGNPIRGAQIAVTARTDVKGAPFKPVGQLKTDARGRFRFRLPPGPSRIVRFAYAGAPLIRPQLRAVKIRVPAESSIRASRRTVVNGDAVAFTGRVRTGPIPDTGKLVELQFFSRGSWRTFKTTHTDKRGVWRHTYRFTGTVGRQTYRLRVHMPRENGYQYAEGGSRPVRVTVRGL